MNLSILNQEQKNFRDAMSQLAAGVCIITTNGNTGPHGITATSVCSITDTPPTILVCINKKSKVNQIFKDNQNICINILSSKHLDAAKHFAGITKINMQERFLQNEWKKTDKNPPYLKDALVYLKGQINEIKEYGTHSLFFTNINIININNKNDNLVYYNRNFCSTSKILDIK